MQSHTWCVVTSLGNRSIVTEDYQPCNSVCCLSIYFRSFSISWLAWSKLSMVSFWHLLNKFMDVVCISHESLWLESLNKVTVYKSGFSIKFYPYNVVDTIDTFHVYTSNPFWIWTPLAETSPWPLALRIFRESRCTPSRLCHGRARRMRFPFSKFQWDKTGFFSITLEKNNNY